MVRIPLGHFSLLLGRQRHCSSTGSLEERTTTFVWEKALPYLQGLSEVDVKWLPHPVRPVERWLISTDRDSSESVA